MTDHDAARQPTDPPVDLTGRGSIVVIFVIAAIGVNLYTTLYFAAACGIGENQSDAFVDSCDSKLYDVPLGGVLAAVAGGVTARAMRREWPWLAGVAVALLLAGLVWMLAPD